MHSKKLSGQYPKLPPLNFSGILPADGSGGISGGYGLSNTRQDGIVPLEHAERAQRAVPFDKSHSALNLQVLTRDTNGSANGSGTITTTHGVLPSGSLSARDDAGPTHIIDNVYLGDNDVARQRAVLRSLGITHVLNMAKECLNHFEGQPELGIRYERADLVDFAFEDLLGFFPRGLRFIDSVRTPTGTPPGTPPGASSHSSSSVSTTAARAPQRDSTRPPPLNPAAVSSTELANAATAAFALPTAVLVGTGFDGSHVPSKGSAGHAARNGGSTGGKVLVHCFAGRSRSAAMVVAYLMYRYGVRLPAALQHVKARRPKADPYNFLHQLQEFERRLDKRGHFTRASEAAASGVPFVPRLADVYGETGSVLETIAGTAAPAATPNGSEHPHLNMPKRPSLVHGALSHSAPAAGVTPRADGVGGGAAAGGGGGGSSENKLAPFQGYLPTPDALHSSAANLLPPTAAADKHKSKGKPNSCCVLM